MYTGLLIPAEFQLASYKKETLAQVFSCEFCEISKNIIFTEHLWATASIWNTVHFSKLDIYSYINKQCENQCKNSNKKCKLKKNYMFHSTKHTTIQTCNGKKKTVNLFAL